MSAKQYSFGSGATDDLNAFNWDFERSADMYKRCDFLLMNGVVSNLKKVMRRFFFKQVNYLCANTIVINQSERA